MSILINKNPIKKMGGFGRLYGEVFKEETHSILASEKHMTGDV